MLEKFKVKTFGCQMNVYDSQKISEIFYNLGYKNTLIDQEADFYVINTCHIRNKAKEKLYSELGKMMEGCGKNDIMMEIMRQAWEKNDTGKRWHVLKKIRLVGIRKNCTVVGINSAC